ncbi:MAG: ArsR/SmtB family transcription factor [Brevundimonas aurantiaca]|uniref:ArsR/SmtB family transcription factor n=2 Tax=Brevundimonas TaxID=41275 RepID=UPI00391B2CCD
MTDAEAPTRQHAADRALAMLDTALFRALCEPARIAIVAVLIRKGPSDIGAVADELPQDRSVISRHLRILADAGVVVARRNGRHVFYELDGPQTCDRLEGMVEELRRLVPYCCPAPERRERQTIG